MCRLSRIFVVALGCVLLSSIAAGQEKGSIIEVREGDSWTKATVIGSEGRKTQVRYDDGTEEWVTADRIRSKGAAAAPGAAQGATPAKAPDAAPRSIRAFSVDQEVEVKRGGKWHVAQVRQLSKGWLFVAEDKNEREKRWIEPWAVRVVGSAYDIEGDGTKIWPSQPGQVAPKEAPAQAPTSIGNQFVLTPEDQRPPTNADLDEKVEDVSLDNSRDPAAGGDPNIRIPTTQPTSEFAAWGLRNIEGGLQAIIPAGPKTAVVACNGAFGKWNYVVRTSLSNRSQLDKRPLNLFNIKVMSAANDGDLLLTVTSWDKHLQFWQWGSNAYKLVSNVRFQGEHITAASFIGSDKAIVGTHMGNVHFVDLPKKQVIGSVKATNEGKLFVHPSGQLVGILTSSSTALLLRVPDFSVIAEFPDAGLAGNVTVDASGQFAAYPTSSGVIRVVKVADGSQLGVVSVGAAFKGRIELVEDKFLIVDHNTVYDIKTGIPVWIYNSPNNSQAVMLANGQFLIAVGQNNMIALATASIPDQSGKNAMKSASPDRFILAPGTRVKIEADYGPFGEDKQKAQETMEEVVRSAGMTISEANEEFRLALAIAAGPSEKRDYAPDIFSGPMYTRKVQTVDVPSNVLTATLTCNGEAVWSQQIRFQAGSFIRRDKDRPIQDVVNEAAKPNVGSLKSLKFPSYLPIGAKPGSPAALGSSTLQDRRFVPDKLPEPKGARPKTPVKKS